MLTGLVLLLAWAFGLALGLIAGVIILVSGGLLVLALLRATAPVISVSDDWLRVGPARLPVASIERARAVTPTELRALRGPGADARMFVELRPWSTSRAVLLDLADDSDPHPGWLFSVRDPDRLLAALAATMGTRTEEDG